MIVPKNQRGFGMGELLVTFAVFSVIASALLGLNAHLQKNATKNGEVLQLDLIRDNILSLIHDPTSWSRIVAENGAPPVATPPFSSTTGNLIDLYAGSSWAAEYEPSTDLSAGYRVDGTTCTGFSATESTPNCPFRYNVRWFIASNVDNPIVYVTANLQVTPGLPSFNVSRYSYDAAGDPPNPIIRQYNFVWTMRGSVDSVELYYLNTASLPSCAAVAGFTLPGLTCPTAGRSCRYCASGIVSGVCPTPGWQLVTCN